MTGHVEASANTHSNLATYYTLKEAADYLQVSERTIQRATKSGRLVAYKPSRNLIRFRRSQLDAFMESGATAFCVSGEAAK
jgi:excisionase family DNA binding protein